MPPKLTRDLIPEMTWSECAFAAAENITTKKVKGETRRVVTGASWKCPGCATKLKLKLKDDIVADAQSYLDLGWGYVRTKHKFEARCPDCRRKRKAKQT